MRKLDPALHERLEKLIAAMGYELVGYELLPQGRRMVFRLFIDKEKGVNVDDCSHVSHQVSALLDVEDPIPGGYNLEVSSPGIDRPLFTLAHFRQYVGSRVKIRLSSAVNQRRLYKGLLRRVDGETIYLLPDSTEQEIALPFSAIEKANIIADIRF